MTRIGFAQYEVVFGDYDHNVATVEQTLEQAGDVDLLVFPELGLTGYEFKDAKEVERYAEPSGTGQTAEWLKGLAAKHNAALVLGYPEYTTHGCHNSAMLACPDGSVHNYRKLHLFSRETELFIPGDAAPPVVDTPAGRVGIMICFDWVFPETARMLALKGAQIIAHPSNLVMDYCQRAMYCRCLENAVFAVTANRIGTEDRAGRSLTFTGQSQITDPKGEVIALAMPELPQTEVIEIDPARADDKMITEYNHLLNDRRPEIYDQVTDVKVSTDPS